MRIDGIKPIQYGDAPNKISWESYDDVTKKLNDAINDFKSGESNTGTQTLGSIATEIAFWYNNELIDYNTWSDLQCWLTLVGDDLQTNKPYDSDKLKFMHDLESLLPTMQT